jgi:hypothetical protein
LYKGFQSLFKEISKQKVFKNSIMEFYVLRESFRP